MIFLETQILGKDQNGVRTFSVHVLQSYKPEKGKLGTGIFPLFENPIPKSSCHPSIKVQTKLL